MKGLVREGVLLAIAGVLSWWLFLDPRRSLEPQEPQVAPPAYELAVLPQVLEPVPPVETPPVETLPDETPPDETPQVEAPPNQAPPEPAADPPPPERGTPEGLEEAPAGTDGEEEAGPGAGARAWMEDESLLEAAQAELEGRARKGFETVLRAEPEEQLAIARYFGEELVLVPYAALDPDARDPRFFRLSLDGEPRVESVSGPPPLSRYRQYRDLFAYEYARLPEPLRSLRKSVLVRSEVYVFGALIPAAEWALVIGRRSQALGRCGRELGEVRRFTLQYEPRPDGSFDFDVLEILFEDGQVVRPASGKVQDP